MNNLGIKSGEVINLKDLVETDIFRMLMARDHVREGELLKLCEETRREIDEFRASSAA